MFNIGKEYNAMPSGRKYGDGLYSGERFRLEYLLPMLQHSNGRRVILHMDDAIGYPSSWLDEVFGGLVRYHGYSKDTLKTKIGIHTFDQALYEEIWGYIDISKPDKNIALALSAPEITIGRHEPTKYQKWYLWQKADDSFEQKADMAKFGHNLPSAPLGYKMDTTDTLILKCKNVEPHTDSWSGESRPPCVRRSLFWLVDCKQHIYFGLRRYNAIKMKQGQYVVFDDTVEHYVMSDKLWVGCAWQLSILEQP